MDTLARLYMTGDKAGAVGAFMQATLGPDYRQMLDAAVPSGYAQAVGDADPLFAQELPALQGWQFTREEARRISQPVLVVLGAESSALWTGFKEGYEVLLECIRRADGFVLPGANHGLQMQNPRSDPI